MMMGGTARHQIQKPRSFARRFLQKRPRLFLYVSIGLGLLILIILIVSKFSGTGL
jgi:hypothetical protein